MFKSSLLNKTPLLRFPVTIAAAILLITNFIGCDNSVSDLEKQELTAAKRFGSWAPAVSIDPVGVNNVNTLSNEGCPSETVDGKSLFLASNRDGQLDIWVTHRSNPSSAWQEPEKLTVNSTFNDFCPTPLPGGGLLFVSTRPGGCGEGTADIYQTQFHPTQGWSDPEHLGCGINSSGNEFSPSYVSAGGGMLYFSSDREGGPGFDKIYVSMRQTDGSWGEPVEVTELNYPGFSTARPTVSKDGQIIVFDSNRPGGLGNPDIWASERTSILDTWSEPVNLGSNVNSASGETRPALSRDGKRLYFGSPRSGGIGMSDIYVSISE